MSAIFGFVNLDGQPASPENLQAMASALENRGYDSLAFSARGCTALGHALLAVAPESRHEAMPHHDPDADIFLTAAARLDNRDELLDFFAIPTPDQSSFPDGQLVLLSHEKWGEDSPEHLLGDWSFAVWNNRLHRLFVARDQLGNTGLFYYNKPPLFVFASGIEGVLAHPEVPHALNEHRLAGYLGLSVSGGANTFWQDVHSLEPAYVLTITPEKADSRCYWHLEDAPSVRFGSQQAYLDGFLDHYRRAVRVRLRSVRPIGSTLSAGLDSSSVTALAAEALQNQGRELIAFTSVPMYPAEHLVPGAIADEWPLAYAAARHYENITHIPVRAENVSPLAAIRRSVDILHAPQYAVVNMFWVLAILDEARKRNLGVLLTGQLGNGGISWSGGRNRIAAHFSQGRWDKGMQALTAWKRRQGCSWTTALKHHLRPFFQPVWQQRHHILQPWIRVCESRGPVHPDFARRMDPEGNIKGRFVWALGKPLEPLEERLLTLIRNGAMGGPIWHTFGGAFGLEVRDPTADIRLLEFCMGIPDEQHTYNGGERMLLRRAMSRILPDEVRWNPRRGRQAADVALRLTSCREEVCRELGYLESTPVINRYLECPAMKRIWKSLQAPGTAQSAAGLFLRGFAAGVFLISSSAFSQEMRSQGSLRIKRS